ncbi:hypothetical protein H6804_03020 [Candidatus Nomurabacteria bacterium]|uniref:Uncharacterized protein n=1 Tax=candidate division WWE3 bacterium TaxID=2053526 RepID=A0A955E1I2_UNCKA|nr:hypothetical protein [candidate division WWE3 bacterium]MCB9827223.1 hypothetical protein [Candidatus Nomurabacteria bacterium]HXK52523.1 hypothetical protein [bacterium]
MKANPLTLLSKASATIATSIVAVSAKEIIISELTVVAYREAKNNVTGVNIEATI